MQRESCTDSRIRIPRPGQLSGQTAEAGDLPAKAWMNAGQSENEEGSRQYQKANDCCAFQHDSSRNRICVAMDLA